MDTILPIYVFLCCGVWIFTSTTGACNGCDCAVRENPREPSGVRTIKPQCQEGQITWYDPYGAVRIIVQPRFSGDFRFCFSVNSGYILVKISREIIPSTKTPVTRLGYENSGELQTVLTTRGQLAEYCITSSENLILYLEPEKVRHPLAVPKISMFYDIEKIPRNQHDLFLEECRPCSEDEILEAYCSSDFVAVGSMSELTQNRERQTLEIHAEISQIVRQKGSLFNRTDRKSKTLQGTISVPAQCGVMFGSGSFLFTGRVKLGQMRLGCAPYIEKWQEIVEKAEAEGRLMCSYG
ncbi:hypothetical protein CHS0354_041790 [Potamilus streckersoni]|uniref:NTR domain-containing protein n=1 Tax=Potamilus streckersoni TaxID=2493646 RepID=A0AAE0T149_9BIVA|nr:hypothetical protein CHS0354_041790 [Potamilus streckersoni]